jgi:hypothetical protein
VGQDIESQVRFGPERDEILRLLSSIDYRQSTAIVYMLVTELRAQLVAQSGLTLLEANELIKTNMDLIDKQCSVMRRQPRKD